MWIPQSGLFHSIVKEGKKTNFENVTPRFNIRNIIDTTVSSRIKLHAVSNYIIQLKQWFIAISFIEWAKFPEPSSGSEWLTALTPSLNLYQSLIFESNIKSKCLWVVVISTVVLLNVRLGWFLFEVLPQKLIFWACLVESGLKIIFYCRAHSSILVRSPFSKLDESVISWTTDSSDVSSAKSFAFKFKTLG